MPSRLTILAAAALVAATLPALAADMPDMKGTWKGLAEGAVLVGNTPYRSAEPGKPVTFSNEPIEFTFTIDEQQGPRFSGVLSSAKHSETLIGHLYPDREGGVMLDDDGRYAFTLKDASTMEVCYDHLKPDSKVIACWTARRPQ